MTLPVFGLPQSSRWRRRLARGLATLGLGAGGLVAVGDFGLGQHLLNGVEQRALAGRCTAADRWGLRLLYGALQLGGRVVYPRASGLLHYYCTGAGDTLRFAAGPLLRHPDVRRALRLRRPGITFRHQASAGPFYVAQRTDWDLYYAFDVLYFRYTSRGVELYDHYFFQPLARRSYTRFRLGRLQCKLNDGLIRVAYPRARPFVAYGRVPAAALAYEAL